MPMLFSFVDTLCALIPTQPVTVFQHQQGIHTDLMVLHLTDDIHLCGGTANTSSFICGHTGVFSSII